MTVNAIRMLKVFYSYAPTERDELLFGEMRKHLAYLQRQGLISSWSRHDVQAGQDMAEQIDIKLNTSDMILLLISSDFLASDACYHQMERALERHDSRTAHVILVYLRPCDEHFFNHARFSEVQILPSARKHIDHIFPYFRDKAFAKVVQGIYKVIEAQSPPQALPRLIILKPRIRELVITISFIAILMLSIIAGIPLASHYAAVTQVNLTATAQAQTTAPVRPTDTITASPVISVTPSPILSGSVLYRADFSKPENIYKEWDGTILSGGIGWQITNRILFCDGNSTDEPLWIQQTLPTANYAVEARIQLTDVNYPNYSGPTFGLLVRGEQGQPGYVVGIGGNFALDTAIFSTNSPTAGPITKSQASYHADLNWHTYRAEVKNNVIRFLIDGKLVFEYTDKDNLFPSPGNVGLESSLVKLRVSSFTVTAL